MQMSKNTECVLLHGWGVTNTIWQDFADHLTVFNNVSMPCLYEAANKTADNKLESMAEVLSNKINSDSIIIAWSLGGLLASHMAKLTDKLKAIVFIASTPCFVNKGDWPNVIDRKDIDGLQNKLSTDTESLLKYFAGLIAYGDTSIKETNKFVRNNLADKKDQAILSSWLTQMQETDQRNEFSELNLPIQIILGKNDSLINSKIETQLKLLNPKIESEVINNCGHAPFISEQEQTIKIINEFINAKFN